MILKRIIQPVLFSMLFFLPMACNLASNTGDPTGVSSPTDTSAISEEMPVVYYYFVAIPSNTFPAGSVVFIPDNLILAPTLSEIARTPDTATNIQSGLNAMLNDPRNIWTSENLTITSVNFTDGYATVILSGDISGTGDVVLIATRMQFLMTIFANEAVESATVTLNDENIGNLGISHSSQAKSLDYAYTRTEIEIFMAENSYNNNAP